MASEWKAAEASEQPVITVGPAAEYKSISSALDAAQAGAIIAVAPGLYTEQLLLSRPVTVKAEQAGRVIVEWRTSAAYQPVVQCTADHCQLIGLTLQHASPSVANNYAVYNQGGMLSIRDCDISSTTGSGIASEGGRIEVGGSRIHDCHSHGIAVFSDLDGQAGVATVLRSFVVGNRKNGILAREDSQIYVRDSEIASNLEYGILLKDSTAEVVATRLQQNGKGQCAGCSRAN